MKNVKSKQAFILILSLLSCTSSFAANGPKPDTIIAERAIDFFSWCIVSGNVKVLRCWKASDCGSLDLHFLTIQTPMRLIEFWDSLKCDDKNHVYDFLPEVPFVDFSRNMIIAIEPGEGPIICSYSVNFLEKADTIQVNAKQYMKYYEVQVQTNPRPVLIYEIPKTNKVFSWSIDRLPGTNWLGPR